MPLPSDCEARCKERTGAEGVLFPAYACYLEATLQGVMSQCKGIKIYVEMFSLNLYSKPKKSEKQTPLLLTTLSISSWCRSSLPLEKSQTSFSRKFSRPALSDCSPFLYCLQQDTACTTALSRTLNESQATRVLCVWVCAITPVMRDFLCACTLGGELFSLQSFP